MTTTSLAGPHDPPRGRHQRRRRGRRAHRARSRRPRRRRRARSGEARGARARPPGVGTEACDLTDEAAVHDARASGCTRPIGPVDGILHLVGGWRGGGGLAGPERRGLPLPRALAHGAAARHAAPSTPTCGRRMPGASRSSRPPPSRVRSRAARTTPPSRPRARRGRARSRRASRRRLGMPAAAGRGIRRLPGEGLDGLEAGARRAFTDLWARTAAEINDTIVELTDPSL